MVMRVPELQQQFRYQDPRVPAARLQGMQVQTNAAMFGAESGRQMEKAGYLVQRGADQMAHLVNDYNNTKAREGASQFQQDFLAWQTEAAKKVGKDGISTGQDYDQWAQQRMGELTKGMSEVQRGRFQSLVGERMALQKRWAEGYGQEQDVVHKTSLFKAEMSGAGNLIATNPGDPDMVAQGMRQIEDAAYSLAKLKGLDPKAGATLMQESVDEHLGGTIHNLIQQGKTGAASALMKQHGGQLGGMTVGKLNAAMTREMEHHQAQARAAQTLRRMEARQIASLAPDRLSYAAQTGDFSAVEQTASQLEKMGATAEAAELRGSIELQRTANTITDGLRGMPLLDMEAEAQKSFADKLTPDNAREVGQSAERVLRNVANHKTAFLQDPAAYVAQMQPLDPSTPARERFQRTLDMQAHLGQGMDFTPQLLPKAQQLKIRNEYESLQDGTKKLQYVRGLQQEAGEFFPQLARETKLPEAVISLSPVLAEMADREGGALLMAAGAQWKDLPGGDQKAVKDEALQAADDSKVLTMLAGIQKALPYNEKIVRQMKTFRETLGKAQLAGLSAQSIDGLYDVLNDSGMHLAVPKSLKVKANDLENVLFTLRDEVRTGLEDMDVMPKQARGNGHLSRIWRANAARAADQGVWVNSADGLGADLVDSHDGTILHHVRFDEVPTLKNRHMQKRMQNITEGGL